jgi:hypothetical protein
MDMYSKDTMEPLEVSPTATKAAVLAVTVLHSPWNASASMPRKMPCSRLVVNEWAIEPCFTATRRFFPCLRCFGSSHISIAFKMSVP